MLALQDVKQSGLEAALLPSGILLAFAAVAIGVGVWQAADGAEGLRQAVAPAEIENTRALGLLMYDKYFLLFQLAGHSAVGYSASHSLVSAVRP